MFTCIYCPCGNKSYESRASREVSFVTNLCEIPIVSATALDETLTSSGPGKAAIQKYRHEMRKKLDPGLKISIGRGVTEWLTDVPPLFCGSTASRWNMKNALKLGST